MISLFECKRLAAKISKASCSSNRQRGVFACEGCPGLGAATDISLEVITMARVVCKIDGCNKLSQHGMNGIARRILKGLHHVRCGLARLPSVT